MEREHKWLCAMTKENCDMIYNAISKNGSLIPVSFINSDFVEVRVVRRLILPPPGTACFVASPRYHTVAIPGECIL